MLGITTNIGSLIAQRGLNTTSDRMTTTLQRLSTGLKINSGADGPAALVISEQQQAQIAGMNQALDNTAQAVSMVQTTEGALSTINNLLTQIRSLALSSANAGVNDTNALNANQAQVANALATIDRIAANTQFNSKNVLNGSAAAQSGSSNNVNIAINNIGTNAVAGSYTVNITTAAERANVVASVAQTAVLTANETLTINGVGIALQAGWSQQQVVDAINSYSGQTGVAAAIDAPSGNRTQLYTLGFGSATSVSVQSNAAAPAADTSGFATAAPQTDVGVDIVGNFNGVGGNATGVGSVLTGTSGGVAKGVSVNAALAAGSLTTTVTGAGAAIVSVSADNSLIFHIGSNANQIVKVGVNNVTSAALGIGVQGVQFASLSGISVTTQSGSQDTIQVVDAAIAQISNVRAALGAVQQQTLSSSAQNLSTTVQNTISAQSVIRDTDFAAETANYSKQQVLMQVGTAILQNANQSTALIARLFQ
jgi:flagellin